MPIAEIKKVCFVGAGTMGCYNSLITALAGYQVALYDISKQALEKAPENQLNWSPALMERGVADPRTLSETMDIVKRFVKSQGQIYVVLKKEREGYLHNAMFGGLLGTAMTLAAILNVDFKKIDQAWMSSKKNLEERAKQIEAIMGNPGTVAETTKIATDFLDSYIQKGELGVKTGKGFYSYPDPDYQKPDFLK
jgi:3-hydroxyacyl-CoA dehydrogenase